MMENLRLAEENITKVIRNLFRVEKGTEAIKDRILRDSKNLFEHKDNKVEVIETKHYQLNILIKLVHI